MSTAADMQRVIDGMPLGERMRTLMVESLESMSPEEQNRIVSLYDELVQGLPSALDAVKQIRGGK